MRRDLPQVTRGAMVQRPLSFGVGELEAPDFSDMEPIALPPVTLSTPHALQPAGPPVRNSHPGGFVGFCSTRPARPEVCPPGTISLRDTPAGVDPGPA